MRRTPSQAPATAAVLRFRDVLLATERLQPDVIRSQQRSLLDKLLQHCQAHVPFYGSKLRSILRPGVTFTEAWNEIPLLRRDVVQEKVDELRARALPPLAGKVQEGKTSGSTGRALRYFHEELLDIASAAQTDRAFEWWSLNGKKPLATFMSIYTGLDKAEGVVRSGGWRIGVPGGKRHIMELMVDIDRQLDWLKRVRPSYLFARGGRHIVELATRAEERNERIRFDRIVSGSSPMVPEAIPLARRVFRSRIADMYGASETGLIACSCPDCGLMHGCDETVIVEVLRDDGSACGEGETGRVVLTPLYAYAMPLLRYEIGDYATRGPNVAPCGRGLSTLVSIAGRYRNAFFLRDGRVIHPYAASRFAEVLSFRQIQFVQTDYEELEIRYVPRDPNAKPVLADVEKFVRESFDASFRTVLKPMDEFEVPPNGKFEETLSLVERPALGRVSTLNANRVLSDYGPPNA
jgi:phenylacetate-CoA ligase